MRTAIIVYETSEMSIDTSEVGLNLEKMDGLPRKLGGPLQLTLDRGVYKVISNKPITLSIADKVKPQVDIVTSDVQDEVPKPRPQIISETDTASPNYQKFQKAFEAFFRAQSPAND